MWIMVYVYFHSLGVHLSCLTTKLPMRKLTYPCLRTWRWVLTQKTSHTIASFLRVIDDLMGEIGWCQYPSSSGVGGVFCSSDLWHMLYKLQHHSLISMFCKLLSHGRAEKNLVACVYCMCTKIKSNNWWCWVTAQHCRINVTSKHVCTCHCRKGSMEVVTYLLGKAQCNLNATTIDRRTPLHLACQ